MDDAAASESESAGLQRVLGGLSKVAMCMEDANMSFCTGQILPHFADGDSETMAV
jgi:hypothetical protein